MKKKGEEWVERDTKEKAAKEPSFWSQRPLWVTRKSSCWRNSGDQCRMCAFHGPESKVPIPESLAAAQGSTADFSSVRPQRNARAGPLEVRTVSPVVLRGEGRGAGTLLCLLQRFFSSFEIYILLVYTATVCHLRTNLLSPLFP